VAFVELDAHRVTALIDPRNEASVSVARRLGMRLEAHCRECVWLRGEWTDEVTYAITASEWRG